MPLATAKTSFKTSVEAVFSNVGDPKNGIPCPTAQQKAQELSTAVHALLVQAVPQTQVSGQAAAGQTVAAFVTTTPAPVSGSGTGGLDSSSPAIGLDAAKAAFVTSLTTSFANNQNTVSKAAQDLADAIVALYGKAKVLTQVTGTFAPGSAVPAPVGPVGPGAWTGSGTGGIESSSPGTGLLPATLGSDLLDVISNTGNVPSVAASGIADAVIAFAKTAVVTTTDTGSASGGVATVSPDSGAGSTTGPSAATGTGTGSVA